MSVTIGDIANKVACGGADAANLGKRGCLSLFGTPTNLLAVEKGTVIPSTTQFNLAYLTPQIQKGVIIPILGASSFEDTSAEDAYSTNSSGIKRLNLKGLPEYKLMFEEGHEFYKQLANLQGFKNFDFIIGDDEGNWMLATNSAGNYQGFQAGHITPELTKRKVKGGDAESKSLLVQFLDRQQFDKNYAILHQDELTFTPSDVPAVNGVVLTYDAIPSPGNTINVTALLASDVSTPVVGLAVANFLLGIGSASETPASLVETTGGKYALTTTTAIQSADVVTTDLWAATLNVDVTDVSGVLFRSALISEVAS